MDNKTISTLEDVSVRLDTISRILSGLQNSLFDGEIDITEHMSLYNWHVANYDLIKHTLLELSCSLEEQEQIIDGLIRKEVV